MNDRERQLAAIYTTQDLWETAGYVPRSSLASALEANNLQAAKIKELEVAFENSIQAAIKLEGRIHGQAKIIEALEQKVKLLELDAWKQGEKTHIAEEARTHYQNLYSQERDEHASTKLALRINIESTQILRDDNEQLTKRLIGYTKDGNLLPFEYAKLADENKKLREDIEFKNRAAAEARTYSSICFTKDHSMALEHENNKLRKEARELNTEIRKLKDDLAANDRGASQDSKQLRDLTEMHENCLNDNACLYQANLNLQNKLSILEKEKAQFCNSDELVAGYSVLLQDNNRLTTENIQLKEGIKAAVEALCPIPEYIRVRKPKRFGVF